MQAVQSIHPVSDRPTPHLPFAHIVCSRATGAVIASSTGHDTMKEAQQAAFLLALDVLQSAHASIVPPAAQLQPALLPPTVAAVPPATPLPPHTPQPMRANQKGAVYGLFAKRGGSAAAGLSVAFTFGEGPKHFVCTIHTAGPEGTTIGGGRGAKKKEAEALAYERAHEWLCAHPEELAALCPMGVRRPGTISVAC